LNFRGLKSGEGFHGHYRGGDGSSEKRVRKKNIDAKHGSEKGSGNFPRKGKTTKE